MITKTPYKAPVLTERGSVRERTLQSTVAHDEGNGIPELMLSL